MSSQSLQKKEADLSSLVGDSFTSQVPYKEEVVEVNSAPYQEISPSQFMLDSAIINKIGDKDLYDFYMKEPSEQRLEAIILTKTYLSKMKTDTEKEKVKNLLFNTGPDDLLKMLSLELAGKLTPEEEKRIFGLKINAELTQNSDKLMFGDFGMKRIEGRLGNGLRIESSGDFLEHRKLPGNGILRVIKKGNDYRAIINYEKQDFTMFSLVNIVNKVFDKNFYATMEGMTRACNANKDNYSFGDSISQVYLGEDGSKTEYKVPKDVIVKENFKDYFFIKNIQDNPYLPALSCIFSVVGISTFLFGLSDPNLYLIGGGLLTTFASISDFVHQSKDEEHYGLFQKFFINKQREKRKQDWLISPKKMEEGYNKFSKIADGKDFRNNPDKFRDKMKEFSASYQTLLADFDRLSYCQGAVVDFKAKSISEVYDKTWQIVQSLEEKKLKNI